jgi:tetratricopeptide (TPR) repeat protein
MEVLTYLCSKSDQLISNDELIKACWPNQYIGDSPLHKCIAQLRKVLGDDPKHPRFIKTIPKRGYVFIGKTKGLDTRPQKLAVNWNGDPPYAGLKPYTFEQNFCFFGREQVIEDIHCWLAQKNEDEPMWLSLSAPVGAGKSSLVYAGLLPKLVTHIFVDKKHQQFCNTLDLATIKSPNTAYLNLLSLLMKNELLSASLTIENYTELISNQIKTLNETEMIDQFQSHLLVKNSHSRFVIFIDHLEYLFDNYSTNKPSKEQLGCFFLLIHLLVSSKKCFLITAIREQFLPDFHQVNRQKPLAYHYKIPAFNHTELIDVVNKPVELAGLSFEYNQETRERLSSVIIQQLQVEPFPVSILQFCLEQLYQKRTKQLITNKVYKSIGGITGCLVLIAEQNYLELTAQERKDFESILFYLLALKKDGKTVISQKSCSINNFTGKGTLSVINRFINSGIFRLTYSNEKTFFCLTHNSLLTEWARINQWIKRNIKALYLRHDLDVATERWLYHEKSTHFLLHSSKKIKKLNQTVTSNKFSITEDEKELITSSSTMLARIGFAKKMMFTVFSLSILSLLWLSISLTQKNEQITATRNNAESLISFMLYDLKDKLEPLGKVELLNMVGNKTLDYFAVSGTDHLIGKTLYQWIEALQLLGNVSISKNNYAEAESYFNQTINVLEHALESDGNNEKLLELAMLSNYWMGYSAFLQQNYDTAEPFMRNYLAYANKLVKLFPKQDWQLEQSYALNNLGSVAEKKHLLSIANDYFEQSALIKLALLETQPNNLALRVDLADTRSWQSNIQAKNGKLIIAIQYLQRAMSQIETISSIEDSFNNIESLANWEHKLAALYYDNGDLINALHHSKKAENNIKRLVNNDQKNFLYKEDLLWSYLLSIQVLINQAQQDQALVYIVKSKKLLKQLKAPEIQKSQIIRANVYLLQQQARVMATLKQYQTALVAITDAIKLFKQSLSVEDNTSFYSRIILTKLGIIGMTKDVDKMVIHRELDVILKLLAAKLTPTNPDYDAISIYLTILKFMDKLPIDEPWLKLYESSDYNIPDYSIISSMDIKNEN